MQVGSQVKLKGRVLPQPHAQFGDGRRLLDPGKWNPSKFVNVPGDLMWALVIMQPFTVRFKFYFYNV